jgi:hypothetical protein
MPSPSPAKQAQAEASALKYSKCMRANGVPDFPDPQFLSGGRIAVKLAPGSGVDPSSPTFQAAANKCGNP